MKPKLCLIILILVLITSCENGTDDYRDKFTGEFHFVGYYYHGALQTQDSIEWLQFSDTIEYISIIEKFNQDQLKIIFKPDYSDPVYVTTIPSGIYGLIYPTVNEDGLFSYPEFEGTDHQLFNGGFSTVDSLFFMYGVAGQGGTQLDSIFGERISQ